MRQTIIVEDTPVNEMQIINWYRCLGWEIVNNQTVVATSIQSNANGGVTTLSMKKVKITFERDTAHPNYEILNGYYNRCAPLLADKIKYERIISDGGSGKSWAIVLIVSAIIGLIFGFGYELSQVSSGFWGHSFDAFLAVLYSIIAFCVFSVIGFIIMNFRTKKEYKPKVEEVVKQIEQITRESAQYV